jgi:shikimate dehydrogenase
MIADRYCVMGNPVAHSKSPLIHRAFALQTGERIEYAALLVAPGSFASALRNFRDGGGKGVNVTLPFKEEAWRLVERRSERADIAAAVNTIRFEAEGGSYGDNTDGTGFVRDFRDNHGGTLTGARVLILGAGGAARGIVPAVFAEGPALVVIANRTVDRAREIAARYASDRVVACAYDEIGAGPYEVIIHATSLGLDGGVPRLPADLRLDNAWCYDLMYADAETAFLKWARARGAGRLADGLGMLVEQAAEAFAIWRGVRPDTAPVIAMLRGGGLGGPATDP